LIKDTAPHLKTVAETVLGGSIPDGHPVRCSIDGADGTCVQYDGLVDEQNRPVALLLGYADLRDDGVTVACTWSGSGQLPGVCSTEIAVLP
jgi:hypothetical protein